MYMRELPCHVKLNMFLIHWMEEAEVTAQMVNIPRFHI